VEAEARDSERRYQAVHMELAHANRVATIGQLSSSITHEVNQPLSGVVVNAETAGLWLSSTPPNPEEAGLALARVARDGRRASEVIGRIRALIKKAPPQKERIAVNEAVAEVVQLTQGELMKNAVNVQTQFSGSLPPIEGDRVQLQQVVLNLIMNAIEAMGALTGERRELSIRTLATPDGGVQVTVRDSGPGLAETELERVFSPFYSTKPNGLGIGLSICRSIVEAHGGKLWANAGIASGAEFQFIIPG